ncbi:Pre-rRNA-processing protein TSR2-domain-containing protein [Podospora appendiculata]|uniref:Pre-rRNA-processing protein TSR2-domain-containing protein n=1 Tax=Podospora appendiculata TaxID=314037 RepID=A0AAE0XGK4_9PEZI|nr:Pre-rRNA-processing protein TSR2-domain-containing protein [Podospora appendiculata]
MATATPTTATCQSNFEQGVAFALHLWPALSLAVQNRWGGQDSEGKRDWFAGAIVDLFADLTTISAPALAALQQPNPQSTTTAAAAVDEPEQADVEAVLLQVMLDEFEVNVDDDSALEVAEQVMRVRTECIRGKFDEVDKLRGRFASKLGNADKVQAMFKEVEAKDEEAEWDTDDDDDDDDSEDDDEMTDAPPARKEKEAPEVDEDGFTKVVKRK